MFDFNAMLSAMFLNGKLEDKVGNDEFDGKIVDTCYTYDNGYETAISHPEFDNGDWIIVEYYDDKESATKGHNKWVELIKEDKFDKIRCVDRYIVALCNNEEIFYERDI